MLRRFHGLLVVNHKYDMGFGTEDFTFCSVSKVASFPGPTGITTATDGLFPMAMFPHGRVEISELSIQETCAIRYQCVHTEAETSVM